MAIVFARVEERLVHGQIAFAWSHALDFDVIVVVDNESANDETLKSIQEMACPRNKRLVCYTVEEAINKLPRISKKVFCIAKSPIAFRELLVNGVKFEKLNIGSIHFKPGKKEIFRTVCVSEEEEKAFKEIINLGVKCEIQKLPTEKIVDLENLI